MLIEAGHDYPNIDELPDEIRQGHATGADMAIDPDSDHNWGLTAKATPFYKDMPVPRGKKTREAPVQSTDKSTYERSQKTLIIGSTKVMTNGLLRKFFHF
ncbi:MAG: hypothetical protein Ct9H300mP19_16890 [Dehalococcoidia bacterium]|nr:MAG: hypothetical protein Ct9H300mP19_16890 [Dehalococcoidia bacterium]